MITTTINNGYTTANSYPKLMISTTARGDLLVFMLENKKGVVIVSDRPTYEPGQYCTDFIMGSFRDYIGTITISNSK